MRNTAIAASLTLLALFSTARAEPPLPTETERLEALGRIWVYVDFFNPYLGTAGVDWDMALLEAIPAVRNAQTREQFKQALDKMLAATGDPLARMFDQQAEDVPPARGPVVRVEDGAAVLNCAAAVRALADGKSDLAALIHDLARPDAPRGAVVDCRKAGGEQLWSLLPGLIAARVTAPIRGGAFLVRFHDGFPTQTEISSGGYSTGMSTQELAALSPQEATRYEPPLVFLIDESMNEFVPQLGALQAAGLARIVSESAFEGDAANLGVANTTLRMTYGLYIYPDGGTGFTADAISTGGEALQAAIAQLDSDTAVRKPQMRRTQQRLPPRGYNEIDVPSPEMRLLALYRLWGTVEYFFPYKALMDQPWGPTLAEFVPTFLAADTREAYETAAMRLAARMDDSHAGVGFTRTLFGRRPNLDVRFIEGRPVVTEIRNPALKDTFSPGDEIVSVDGKTVAEIKAEQAPLVGHSTPQALRSVMALRLLSDPQDREATIELRSADKQLRTVRVPREKITPQPSAEPAWKMLHGNVGYIDLDELAYADADRAIDELMGARALIFDLRGYPNSTGRSIALRLARNKGEILGPWIRRPSYIGPPQGAETRWKSYQQLLPQTDKARYKGPVFVMINERAVSQAEHTAMYLEAAADVTFVGEPTVGANGDVTILLLPGGLHITMTGNDVRHPNGSQLQRIGIQPDVPVAPTIAGIRAGRDEVLERTLELARK